MSLYVLDTNILTLFEREHPTVCTRIAEHPAEEIAISVVTVEEQIIRMVRPASPSQAAGKACLGLPAACRHCAVSETRADPGIRRIRDAAL